MNNEEWRINIVKDGRGDSSVFFVMIASAFTF